ncbi:MAG: HDIG domain-containing protein [Nitrospiraceae bacterium]|nr:HDIG domain-containing protein [Nitrospiraceae bacterium]
MKSELVKDNSKTPLSRELRLKILFLFAASVAVSLSVLVDLSVQKLLGGTLIGFVLLFFLYRDIMRYKPAYINNYSMLFLLVIMIVSTLVIGRAFEYVLKNLSIGTGYIDAGTAVYGIPIAAGAMLVTLLFDFHTAITFSFTISLLAGYWLQDASYPIYTFAGSLTAAFSVIRCKRRSAILRGGFYVVLANVLIVLILLLSKGELFTPKALSAAAFAVFAGISVSSIVSMMLPLLEHAFKITTDISLLELLDLNQPIMKSLMINAPGTYHHSVIVGNLVEAAAEAVGVNPLLGRVSSYYHDIGKIRKPDYFIENQSGAPSKHDRLTPHMSSMIITNHVKEGVELAKQYKLPPSIIDIISQHHGTSVITYFYQKAKDQLLDENPAEEDYKYAGPKPQTRVAALVMMADAVEAASRVLNDPTPARIAALVDKIINHIFLDGQLDECELTLKDISAIKSMFTYILASIFHKRINYPGFDFGNGGTHREQTKIEKAKSSEDKKGLKQGTPVARSAAV